MKNSGIRPGIDAFHPGSPSIRTGKVAHGFDCW
jgi:hypothetical protein